MLPVSGFHAAAEARWAHDGVVISGIFRDTTLQAFEGCLFDLATGWCGLHGQLLVRISNHDDTEKSRAEKCQTGRLRRRNEETADFAVRKHHCMDDTGEFAGGKPATGRLCQAGLRE